MKLENPGAVIENTIRYEKIKSFFSTHKDVQLLLDLGCGPRPYYEIYAAAVKQSIGADLADSPFPKAGIDIYCSATSIPLENSSVDLILCTEVMHDIPEPRIMLQELNRILKENGTVLLTTPFITPVVDGSYDHYRYTEHGLRYLFNSEGFKIVEISTISDIIGATITLYIKPWLRLWNKVAKKLRIQGIYSIYNPFFFLTVYLPQLLYIWTRNWPLISNFYRKFSYGSIGYFTIAVKDSK
jgi:ubiquinone/menaquinone biosynthesis C-methylase UbiE